VPFELFLRYYQLFLKIKKGHVTFNISHLDVIYHACPSIHLHQSAFEVPTASPVPKIWSGLWFWKNASCDSDIYYGWCLCRPVLVFFLHCALFCCFLLFFAILYLYPSEYTYNRQPALMIPGFSGLPVLYLYFFRRFVLKLNMMMMMMMTMHISLGAVCHPKAITYLYTKMTTLASAVLWMWLGSKNFKWMACPGHASFSGGLPVNQNLLRSTYRPNVMSIAPPVTKIWKATQQCRNWGGLGYLGVTQGHLK